MNWQSITNAQWMQQLQPILTRIPLQNLHNWVIVLLVLLMGALAARLLWLVVPTPQVEPLATVATTATTHGKPSADISSLLAANLFGDYQAKKVVAPVTTDAPKTSLNLRLTGVVSNRGKPEQGTAVIESQGLQQVYGVEEQIEGTSARLRQVYEDRVLLDVNGRVETLMLDGIEYQKLSAQNGAVGEPVAEGQLQEFVPDPAMGPVEVTELDRELIEEPGKLMDYLRATPDYRNGQMYGFKLFPGQDPELFARVGLRPNDVAIEINGQPLNNLEAAARLMNDLREASSASIKVERDGEIQEIQFSLSH
jgi:general secretion pathway protein C